MYSNVEKWYEPADELRCREGFICEMSREDHGFLLGMIKKHDPKKIVELGVAEGGTTAIIANALSKLGGDRELISIDLNERFYHDPEKQTGYQYELNIPYIDFSNVNFKHEFRFGKVIAEHIEDLGNDVDMYIIDTTHRLPGEVLNFLCVLPYLKDGSTIVLHDINLNWLHSSRLQNKAYLRSDSLIATKVLFTAVTAEKYIDFTKISNIGAFVITPDTRKYAEDLFMALTLSWSYMLNGEMLSSYRKIYAKNYPEETVEMFDMALKINRAIISNKKKCELSQKKSTNNNDTDKFNKILDFCNNSDKPVVLYPFGFQGRKIYNSLTETYKINNPIIKADNYLTDHDNEILRPDEVKDPDKCFWVITCEDSELKKELIFSISKTVPPEKMMIWF